MKIEIIGAESFEQAFTRLRQAPLDATGDQKIFIYEHAIIRLVDLYADEINPTSLYVLKNKLALQRELRASLLQQHNIDTLRLPCILHLKVEGESEIIDMAPPYVEVCRETARIIQKEGDRTPPVFTELNVAILKDGIHRFWIAREAGEPVRSVLVHNASNDYLPYAYPNPWSEVAVYDKTPELKKHYRRQDPYTFMRPIKVLRRAGNAPTEWGRK